MTDGVSRLFERVAALRREGQTFVIATVVARRPPVSAHLGDRALVFPDGRMEGFVGGACSREIVRTQALAALRARQARLVCIRPDPAEAQESSPERVVVRMTCASEGAVDVYVEPVVRPRRLVVAGATPVADALARLARAMHYEVVRVVEAAERRDVEAEAAAVGATVETLDRLDAVLSDTALRDGEGGDAALIVASQGHYDDTALEAMLKSTVGYVALVASRRRGDTVRAALADAGVPGLDRLRNPAGLDLGGRSAAEVALSILAEIVQAGALVTAQAGAQATAQAGAPVRAAASPAPAEPHRPTAAARVLPMAAPASTAKDPVCGMQVEMTGAPHTADVDGVRYYFCCGGCRNAFLKNPQRYLAATS